MKNFLISLNGWQRVFIFVVIFLYIPLTIVAITEVEKPYVWKFADENKELVELAKQMGGTLVGQKDFSYTSTYKFIKIFIIFTLTTAFTYFIGFMIGWVIKGFKHSKES